LERIGKKAETQREAKGPPLIKPRDFFPTKIGATWVYKIEIGEVKPLHYQERSVPLNDRRVTVAQRALLPRLANAKERKTFVLAMKVKAAAAQQGPLQYREGVEIEVERDDFGIFKDFEGGTQIVWAIIEPDRFMVMEVLTHDLADAPSAPMGAPSRGQGQGSVYSRRLLFFVDQRVVDDPGGPIQLGIGQKPRDTLQFLGIDNQIPECKRTTCLHLRRVVPPADLTTLLKEDPQRGHFEKGFTEDTWFARGKGLVRLEQKIEEKTSMVWTLVQFSTGAK
jgi:hypothetical protein